MTLKTLMLATVASGIVMIGSVHAADDQQPLPERKRVTPVGERVGEDNTSLGVRVCNFMIVPKVDIEELYNDNIFATNTNETDDFITTVRPQISARSNWSRHALNARAGAEMNYFADNHHENSINYNAALDGRVDVTGNTAVGGGVAYNRDHEERGDPNTLGGGVEPTEYETYLARVGVSHKFGRFSARADGEVKDLDYKNGFTSAGALLNNGIRNRTEYTESARLGYKATPSTEVFVKGDVNTRVYDFKGTTANPVRSSNGTGAVAGLDIDLSGKTKAEAYAGYIQRDYTSSNFKQIEEPTYGGKLTWNASDLTTVTGQINRTIEETVLGNSSGYVKTSYNAGVEHALRRNLVLNAALDYSNNDYKGLTGVQRDDDIVTADIGAKYYMNRNLIAKAGYRYRDRDSNIAGGDYSRNAVLVGLTATY